MLIYSISITKPLDDRIRLAEYPYTHLEYGGGIG